MLRNIAESLKERLDALIDRLIEGLTSAPEPRPIKVRSDEFRR